MTTINLKGYDINFPYPQPYKLQEVFMEKVLTCLDQKTHAVLESPTGTGKTLCLFAPVAAWARQRKKQVHYVVNDQVSEFHSPHFDQNDQQGSWGNTGKSKVWYTSRTHAQIAQTIAEVRKCNTDGLNVRVMGARDQLCINKAVTEEKDSYAKTFKCKELVLNKSCKYYAKLTYEKDIKKYYQNDRILDIEDLISVGKTCGVCPYYLAKKSTESADIILLPYNYIIEEESRSSNSIYLQNDVVIFDEGHNIPSTCEESYEFSLTTLQIAIGIRNLKELMVAISKLNDSLIEDNDIDVATYANNSVLMLKVFQSLESGLEELPDTNELLPVSALYDFLEKAGISERTFRQLMEGIQLFKSNSNRLTLSGSMLETFKLLEKIMNVLYGSAVKSFDEKTISRSFKCGVTIDQERMNKVKKLSLYCFNPSFGIKTLLQMGVQSIIITSGTLSPLKTFIHELGIPNPVTLENGHIAKNCQVPFVILGTGVNNIRMDGTYKNRNDPNYVFSLGMTLTNLISSIPDGVLLLFSSYTMMQNLKEAWEADLGIWTRLNALKRVFLEPRNKDDFINCMENYKRAIDSGNGAVLMGVLRGKVSEGMDFRDQYCRGVFIIGVPFPPINDPRVQGKEKYAESLTVINPKSNLEEKLYNNSFMSVEAMRATNQAIGRVIRHRKDYGIIILIDYRFCHSRLFSNISSWLRGDVPCERNFPMTKKLVRDFFKNIHDGKLGVDEIRCQKVDSNGCPIASYVSYEEYDHKKHVSQPVSWIGGPSESQESKNKVKRQRGHAEIEFVDEEESSQDLVSMYRHFSSQAVTPITNESTNSGSLLDAMENSHNNGVGYKEFDKKCLQHSESSKRKYEENEDIEENSALSSFTLTFPESDHKKHKKFPRLKVRPLIPTDPEELEKQNIISDTSLQPQIKPDEDLKVKLINYYRKVKDSLSTEQNQTFKTVSCQYMKGETELKNVIMSMDELFLSPSKKNLFSEFVICVKARDKEEWKNACKARNVCLS